MTRHQLRILLVDLSISLGLQQIKNLARGRCMGHGRILEASATVAPERQPQLKSSKAGHIFYNQLIVTTTIQGKWPAQSNPYILEYLLMLFPDALQANCHCTAPARHHSCCSFCTWAAPHSTCQSTTANWTRVS